MDYLSAAGTAVYYAAYPIVYILYLILFVLAIITAPLFHLGHYFLCACGYVLRALGKLEVSQVKFGMMETALIGR